MKEYMQLSGREIDSYITILEQEIDCCLACDLPISHLECQVEILRDILRSRTDTLRANSFFHTGRVPLASD